ncbi:MAG TPA: EamA family transporter [Candidatus Cybelea sp.]|nr:EamA family transporter [Candidatus Cybelea sp.]
MNATILALILASVTCSAIAQISLKFGMSGARMQSAIATHDGWRIAISAATDPAVVGGLALYALGAVVWLAVLARVEVSQAYPFVGLGFLFTMALGMILLGDAVNALRICGTLLVVAGVYLVAVSG